MDVINVSKRFFYVVLAVGFLVSPVWATPAKVNQSSANGPWFLGATLGWSWLDSSRSSTTVPNGSGQPAPFNLDRFSINSLKSAGNMGLLVGYRWHRQAAWLPYYSVALRYQYLSSFKMRGTIMQYSLPNFINYDYRLRGHSNIFSILAKANIYQYRSFAPYISFGLGVACNRLNGYTETAYSGIIPRVSPGFRAKTRANFMFVIGAGVDYLIKPNMTLSLGYEYADLGIVKTGQGQATWSNDALNLGHLRSQTVLLALSYQLPINAI